MECVDIPRVGKGFSNTSGAIGIFPWWAFNREMASHVLKAVRSAAAASSASARQLRIAVAFERAFSDADKSGGEVENNATSK